MDRAVQRNHYRPYNEYIEPLDHNIHNMISDWIQHKYVGRTRRDILRMRQCLSLFNIMLFGNFVFITYLIDKR